MHEEIVSLFHFRSRMAIKEKFLVRKQRLPNIIVLILFSISYLDGGVHVRGM
jgi:hypothetical protein